MATHQLPAPQVIDTSRFERVGEGLVARPLPSENHARVQLAVTMLLREQAKTLNYSVLQEWTLDENEQPSHNWMTPDVLVAEKSQRRAESGHLLPPAVLAMEILSPEQTVTAMRLKALRYFSWGILSVWIIDPVAKSAITLSASRPGHGEIVFDGEIEAGGMTLRIAEISISTRLEKSMLQRKGAQEQNVVFKMNVLQQVFPNSCSALERRLPLASR